MPTCPRCARVAPVGDRFCARCGSALGAEPSREGRDLDLLAEWNLDLDEATIAADEAITESIPVRAPSPEPADTVVMAPPREPTDAGPASAGPPARPRPAGRFPWGATLALVGAMAVIVSSVLEWGGPFRATFPRGIPASALLDPDRPASGPNLGILLLGLGTLGALLALLTMAVPFLKFTRRLVGLATLVVAGSFVARTALAVEGGTGRLADAVGIGAAFAAAGGLVQLLAGRWFRR